MTDPGFSGQRVDPSADAAISTHHDEPEGPGSQATHTELAESKDSGGSAAPSPEPGQGTAADGDVPATEGSRQLVKTLRSIERLEESN